MVKEKPHYYGHRQRLREKFLEDQERLADYELLEALLGVIIPRRDTKPLAKELLKRFGNLKGVFSAKEEELLTVSGIGPGVVYFWQLLRAVRIRIDESRLQEKVIVDHPKIVAELATARLGDLEKEQFWVAMLDNRNRLLAWEKISQGTVNQAHVYLREIMEKALEKKASGLILVHNHPGGDPRPSQADKNLTDTVRHVASQLDIRILDHIIITEEDYYSFKSQGLI